MLYLGDPCWLGLRTLFGGRVPALVHHTLAVAVAQTEFRIESARLNLAEDKSTLFRILKFFLEWHRSRRSLALTVSHVFGPEPRFGVA